MKKIDPDRRKAISGFLLAIAKLIFASFILGGIILLGKLPQNIIIAIGALAASACAIYGIVLAKKE